MGVPHCDANLHDPPQTLLDQALSMPLSKRLIASDKKRRRLLRVKWRPQLRQRLFGPILRRPFCFDPQIECFPARQTSGWYPQINRLDTIDPNSEGFAECRAGVARTACGQMKSAIAVPPASTTRSHVQAMRCACRSGLGS